MSLDRQIHAYLAHLSAERELAAATVTAYAHDLSVFATFLARADCQDLSSIADTEVRSFLREYESSATRHMALLNDTKFLGGAQRELILNRQRDVVSAVMRFLRRAYPARVTAARQTALTMMLFGMINWTFTWLRPGGPMSYAAFAEEVIALLEHGLAPAGAAA